MLAVEPGFRPDRALTLQLAVPASSEPAARRAFFQQVVTDTAQLPGVIATGLVSELPLADRFFAAEDPIGRRVVVEFGEPLTLQIVGVVGSILDGSWRREPRQTRAPAQARRVFGLMEASTRRTSSVARLRRRTTRLRPRRRDGALFRQDSPRASGTVTTHPC